MLLPLFSGNLDSSENVSDFIEPLSVLPYGPEHSSHDRDEATVNDHQRDLDAHNDPCAFRISTPIGPYAV